MEETFVVPQTETGHTPVMAREAVAMLGVRKSGMWIDATLGGGGHAELMLERSSPDGLVIGFDRDAEAVKRCTRKFSNYGSRFMPVNANFADMLAEMRRAGLGRADGVLADLGLSSFQLEDAGRGFSFSKKGPLDMRMDRDSGMGAAEVIDSMDESELSKVIAQYGGEKAASRVARAIKEGRASGRIGDTESLAAVVSGAAWRRGAINPATRTFQAIRMAVNRELESLHSFLGSLPEILAPKGRAVVISFHSLEDRAVKAAFADLSKGCVCPTGLGVCVCGRKPRSKVLTSGALMPSPEEVANNPRSRSARLRAVELI